MKNNKYIQSLFVGLAMMVGFTACEDRDPVYQAPESTDSFVLNIPPLADQYYELTEGATIDLTWSAFDYGYAAVANYAVEASLNEDFDPAEEVAATTVCNASIKQSDLALAICSLRGIQDIASYTDEPAREVYFRVKSSLNNIEGSEVISNVIKFSQIKEYCAIREAGWIYLVGNVTGWVDPSSANSASYENWKLMETEIGSNIYSGVFDIEAGAMFRFYSDLTGWDGGDSYGIQEADVDGGVAIFLKESGNYEESVVKGKGNYTLSDWEGGSLKITVNMSNSKAMTVVMEPGGIDYTGKKFIYLVGGPAGWNVDSADATTLYADYKLYDLEDNNVYTGTFTFAPESYFRFYTELGDWGKDGELPSLGSRPVDGENTDCVFAEGVFTGDVVPGKGGWHYVEGGKLDIAVDMNTNTVTFTQK